MTKQRRNEILNVPLAKRILADYSNQLKDEDMIQTKETSEE